MLTLTKIVSDSISGNWEVNLTRETNVYYNTIQENVSLFKNVDVNHWCIHDNVVFGFYWMTSLFSGITLRISLQQRCEICKEVFCSNDMICFTLALRKHIIHSQMCLPLHTAAPHHYALLGSPGLSSVLGIGPSALRRASWAPRRHTAAAVPAGHCHSVKGGKRRCQAHHAFPAQFLCHCRFCSHHQGNTGQEGFISIKTIKHHVNRFNSGLGRAVISIKVFKLYYTLHF